MGSGSQLFPVSSVSSQMTGQPIKPLCRFCYVNNYFIICPCEPEELKSFHLNIVHHNINSLSRWEEMAIFLSLTSTFTRDLKIHWVIGCTRQHHHLSKIHLPSPLTHQACLASKFEEILSHQESLHNELELFNVTSRWNSYINQHIYWPLNPSDKCSHLSSPHNSFSHFQGHHLPLTLLWSCFLSSIPYVCT